MQIPRDLERRMVEAVERTPAVDIYERLMPESKRIGQRFDFISWFLAYAGVEIQALGLEDAELALLGNVNGDPERRWGLLARYWPYIRTTGVGRAVLRIAWDLFGVDEINDRSWKDISAQLWKASAKGFYKGLLCERGNIVVTFVDNALDAGSRSCCRPVWSGDAILGIGDHLALDAVARELGRPCAGVDDLVAWLENEIQQAVSGGCAVFKIGSLPDVCLPGPEEASWAFGRVFRRDESAGVGEPVLQSYLLHRLLSFVASTGRPLQVHVQSEVDIDRLGALAAQYPQIRFLAVYHGRGSAFSLLFLARTRPNLALALGDLWCVAPRLAQFTLQNWLLGVPSNKVFALSGNTTMVEAAVVCAQAARERLAALVAEMVTAGSLDESDGVAVIRRVLFENAQTYFALQVY